MKRCLHELVVRWKEMRKQGDITFAPSRLPKISMLWIFYHPNRNYYSFPQKKFLAKSWELIFGLGCVRMLPEGYQGCHQRKRSSLTPNQGSTSLHCGLVLVHALFLSGPWEHGSKHLDTFLATWKSSFMSVESHENLWPLFCSII